MASALDITQKINSLTNIQKVTGAMNLMASIRLRKLMWKQKALELFEKALGDILSARLLPLLREGFPLFTGHRKGLRLLAIVLTSDRGLCGSHNHSVLKALDGMARTAQIEGKVLEVICLGTKGSSHARRRGYHIVHETEMKQLVPLSFDLRGLADLTVRRFLAGQVDKVVLIHNRYVSTLRQVTRCQTMLPLGRLMTDSRGVEPSLDVDFGLETFGEEVGVRLFRYWLTVALAHSQLSEQAARMTAMDGASKNARDLTNGAIKERNRVRQAGITSELIEIISGKEAMKR